MARQLLTVLIITKLIFCVTLVRGAFNVSISSFEELDRLNETDCRPRYTCDGRSRALDDLRRRNCACDNDCVIYGDCCVNAKRVSEMSEKRHQDWSCEDRPPYGGIFMKSACPVDWTDDYVRALCEDGVIDNRDPFAFMPVTHRVTFFTYKNSFCALCHGINSNLSYWTPRLECSFYNVHNETKKNLTAEFVQDNLEYFPENNKWGFWLPNQKNEVYPYTCEIAQSMPRHIEPSKIRSCKINVTKSCPIDWLDDDVNEACQSFQAIVYGYEKKYWNPYCALCHNINTSLTCNEVRTRGVLFGPRNLQPDAFAMLLDLNSKNSNDDFVSGIKLCRDDEVYDPFKKSCRKIVCGFTNYQLIGGKCLKWENDYTNHTNLTANSTTHSEEFMNCPKIFLNKGDYLELKNGSMYIPRHQEVYNVSDYKIQGDQLLICLPFESMQNFTEKFSPLMGYFTLAGLSISIVCLILHLLVFMLVSEFQNISGKNLASLSLSLLVAYSCFILGQQEMFLSHKTACQIIAIVMYYSFLSAFIWMNFMAFDVWRTLKMATQELRVSAGKQNKRFIVYSFLVWSITLVIVGATVLIDFLPELNARIPEEYHPTFGHNKCWFGRRKALILFFAAPAGIIMLINVSFFLSTAHMIVATTSKTLKANSTIKGSSAHRNFRLYFRLFLIMGLTWIFGFIAGYSDIEYIWYLFIILNTLQGLFIFVAFSCNKKVTNNLSERMPFKSKFQVKSETSASSSGKTSLNTNSQSTSVTRLTNNKFQIVVDVKK